MKNLDYNDARVNYYIHTEDGGKQVAKGIRHDFAEFVKFLNVAKDLEFDIFFRDEDDIDDFYVKDVDEKSRIANNIYQIEDFNVIVPTDASIMCIEVFLK